jgi:hypothetical protein
MTIDQWLFLIAIGWIIGLAGWMVLRADRNEDGVCARMWDALDHGLFGGRP